MDMSNVLLNDIANRENMGIQASSSLRETLNLMRNNNKGAVVVLREQKPVGILTERDVVRLLFMGVDLEEPADQHANKKLIMTSGERTIGYALNLMVENHIRRLVIIDSSDGFLGVVTHKDLLKYLEEDFYRSTLKVKHIVDQLKHLVSVSRKDPIAEVLKRMVEHEISAVPVLEDGTAIGIITEKDILKLANKNISLGDHVEDHMSSPVVFADYDTRLVDIVSTMNAKNISRVVVKNTDGFATGMITNRDLVRNLEGDYNEFLERKLRHSKEVLNLLPEMLLELIDTGAEQLVVWANEKVVNRFGREILDKPVTELVPSDKWFDIYTTLKQKTKIEDKKFKSDESIYECSGFYLPLEKTAEIGRIQLILRDITEEVMLATTDPLTGTYNRRFMNEFLSKEAERSYRTGKTFAIVLVDLDDFKRVNDTYGHLSGDIVLKKVVEIMTKGIRKYDLLGRYGGEEFIIILPEIDKENAVDVAERIRRNIADHEIDLMNGEKVMITVSCGIAFFEEDGMSPDDLLVRSDERLYTAKRAGKNMVVFK